MEEWAKSGLLEFRKVRFAGKGREPNGERQKYGFTGTLSRLNGSGFWKVKRIGRVQSGYPLYVSWLSRITQERTK